MPKLATLNKKEALEAIEAMCEQALNSSESKHWEAGLQDILEWAREEMNLKAA